jgi:hypothetical protein
MKLLLSVLAFTVAAFSITQVTPRQEVEQVFKSWEKAMAVKDARALAALMDKNGYTVSLTGDRWPFSQAEHDLGAWMKTLRSASSKITIDSCSIYRDEAVAWITTVTTTEPYGDPKHRGWFSVTRSADTLRRINGKWKFVWSQDLAGP